VINQNEAEKLNSAVQIYSKDAVFYRSECPSILPEFESGEHMMFADDRNFADWLCYQVPGVHDEPTPDWFRSLVNSNPE
jgi:hypothetical protein